MRNLITIIISNSKAGLLALALLFAFNANAANIDTTVDDILEIDKNGVPNVRYQGKSFTHLPEGSYTSYKYNTNEDGITISASASYRYSQDFNKFVNTSDERVNVIDISGGIDGGISLGCTGIDFGLEALFDFEMGDILEYLPQYIMTQLATEALAQIYATPLISTVMDGIKAMRNATIDFQNAQCDMSKVMDRAEEIKGERIQDCINDPAVIAKFKDDGGRRDHCEDPGELTKMIQEFQCTVSQVSPASFLLSKILDENDVGYTGAGEPLKLTKSRMMGLFIPDFKINVDGGEDSSQAAPEMEIDEMGRTVAALATDYMRDIYIDASKSLRDRHINKEDEREVYTKFDQYKNQFILSGHRNKFTDNDSTLVKRHTSDEIMSIEKIFKSFSSVTLSSINAKSRVTTFKIGAESGPKERVIGDGYSNFKGAAVDALNSGDKCWKKINLSSNSTSWKLIYTNIDASLSSNPDTFSKLMTDIAYCKTLDVMSLAAINRKKAEGYDVYNAFLEYKGSEVALYTTTTLIESFTGYIAKAANATAELKKYCDDNGGPAGMEATASNVNANGSCGARSSDGTTGKSYESCEQYAKENAPGEETIARLQAQLEVLKVKESKIKEYRNRKQFDYLEIKGEK